MDDEIRPELHEQLRRVISWEIDTLLDDFDVTLKPGADVSGLG